MAQKIEFSPKSAYKFQSLSSNEKINYSSSKPGMDLSIIIVNFNTKALTLKCIESIIKFTKKINFEIIVVDNASNDGSVGEFKKLKHLTLIENKENVGFAGANNQGIEKATGKFILFLNSDTEISSEVISDIVLWMDSNPKVGASSCQIVGVDGKIQESGGYFPNLLSVFSWMTIQDLPLVDSIIKPFHPLKRKSFLGNDKFFQEKRELDWVIGAFIMVRKEVIDKVGGWDKDYFMYTEDVDLCFRIRKEGWKIVFLPEWKILHYGGASSTSTEFPLLSEYAGLKKFYKKFYPSWQYPILRILLKIGALGRILLFFIIEGKESAKIYAKAFNQA